MKRQIGVFDSGIGGKTTLNEIIKLLPNENYIYYPDSENNMISVFEFDPKDV